MASLKNMMNVQVKLEPLNPSLLQNAHGSINLANGATGPPLFMPRPAENKKKSKGKKGANVDAEKPGFPDMLQDMKVQIKQETILETMPVKKKRDRFKGMTEEEVLKRVLPDHLTLGLDIAIVGINPGLTAAFVGHHYAGPGNHFWKCLYLSGLIPTPMNAYDDFKLREFGIGFTNIVERTSRGSADLSKKEIQEGAKILKEKIKKFKPKIAVFNGKGIYEVFSGQKKFAFGKQPEPFPECEDTLVFVMPSSSARCTQLPRAVDKVPFYQGLKKLRDHLRGDCGPPEDSEVTFRDVALKTAVKPKTEPGMAPSPAKKRRKKGSDPLAAAMGVELNSDHHALIQQAVQQVKMEAGFAPPGALDMSGGPMTPPYKPLPQQPQQPQQQQLQQQQHVSSAAPTMGGYGMPHTSWSPNMMPIKPDPGNSAQGPSSQPGFYPQHYGDAQSAHSQHAGPLPHQQGQHQGQGSAMSSQHAPWSAQPGLAASHWLQQQYMKPPMHQGQPPPYPYPGQFGPGNHQNQPNQPFPFANPNFSSHLMPKPDQQNQSRDFGSSTGMFDPKVKEEPRW